MMNRNSPHVSLMIRLFVDLFVTFYFRPSCLFNSVKLLSCLGSGRCREVFSSQPRIYQYTYLIFKSQPFFRMNFRLNIFCHCKIAVEPIIAMVLEVLTLS